MKKIKKNITLNDLALQMAKGFNKTNENHEHLARMVSEGFNQVNENHEQLARMVSGGFERVEGSLTTLEDGQEQIKLRLDNVAYKFEVVELGRRVSHLEKKAGVKYP